MIDFPAENKGCREVLHGGAARKNRERTAENGEDEKKQPADVGAGDPFYVQNLLLFRFVRIFRSFGNKYGRAGGEGGNAADTDSGTKACGQRSGFPSGLGGRACDGNRGGNRRMVSDCHAAERASLWRIPMPGKTGCGSCGRTPQYFEKTAVVADPDGTGDGSVVCAGDPGSPGGRKNPDAAGFRSASGKQWNFKPADQSGGTGFPPADAAAFRRRLGSHRQCL